jgi:two-component system NarL family sensor kinase
LNLHMKALSAFLTTFLFTCMIFSQVKSDSLQRQARYGKNYQVRITAYIELAANLELKNFDSVIEIATEGIELARKNADSASVAELKRHAGISYYFKGNYNIAAEYYYEAINILEKINDKGKLAAAYNDLAKLYRKTRDLDKALVNYNKADQLFRQLKDTGGISMILNESGVVFEYQENYKEAIRRYSESLHFASASGDSLGVSYAVSNLAGVYVIEKRFSEAEYLLLRALAIRQQLKDSFAIALNYSDLGATLNAKGDYVKASAYLKESNRVAEKLHYPELQSTNYSELASIAEKTNNFEDAYKYYKQRTLLRDSLYAIEKTKQIEELNTKYETVKKEQKIQEQHNRITRQNFLFLGIAGLLLMSGLLIHSRYKRYQLRQETRLKTEMMNQQELAVKAVLEAEEKERQRIAKDLHDGVGQMMSAAKMNLSAFESGIINNDGQKRSLEKIIELVDESCREVRNVSHIMMPNALLKNNLPAAIKDFVDKLDKKILEVHVNTEGLEERLDSNIETVLYRVIQECVNNVLKHSGATTLDISLIRDKDGVSGTIEDNGKGFHTTDKKNFEGLGLKNIITRIEYLKGTVDFDSRPGHGTVVAFNVPV